LEAPPAFDADFPRLFLDVNAGAGEAAGAGPFGTLGLADEGLFAEHGAEGRGRRLGHPRRLGGRVGGEERGGGGERREKGELEGGTNHVCLVVVVGMPRGWAALAAHLAVRVPTGACQCAYFRCTEETVRKIGIEFARTSRRSEETMDSLYPSWIADSP